MKNHYYQTKAFCYSTSGRFLYAASIHFNEIVIIDCWSNSIVKKISVVGEKDIEELFVSIVYHKDRLLLVPKNAQAFYVIDLHNYAQYRISATAFGKDFQIRRLGMFSCIYGDKIILINRIPFRIFLLNIMTMEILEVDIPKQFDIKEALECNLNDDKIYIYGNRQRKILIVDLSNFSFDLIGMPENNGIYASRIWGNNIYIIDFDNVLFKYDCNNILVDNFKLNRKGFFFSFKKDLFFVAYEGSHIFNFEKYCMTNLIGLNGYSIIPCIYNIRSSNYLIFQQNNMNSIFQYKVVRINDLKMVSENDSSIICDDINLVLSENDYCEYKSRCQLKLRQGHEIFQEGKPHRLDEYIGMINSLC